MRLGTCFVFWALATPAALANPAADRGALTTRARTLGAGHGSVDVYATLGLGLTVALTDWLQVGGLLGRPDSLASGGLLTSKGTVWRAPGWAVGLRGAIGQQTNCGEGSVGSLVALVDLGDLDRVSVHIGAGVTAGQLLPGSCPSADRLGLPVIRVPPTLGESAALHVEADLRWVFAPHVAAQVDVVYLDGDCVGCQTVERLVSTAGLRLFGEHVALDLALAVTRGQQASSQVAGGAEWDTVVRPWFAVSAGW